MNKKQALEETMCLWNAVYEECKNGFDLEDFPESLKFRKAEQFGFGRYLAHCPCCEYVYRLSKSEQFLNCSLCPITIWASKAIPDAHYFPCSEDFESFYCQFKITKNPKFALEIALLAEEELDNLGEMNYGLE